MYNVFVGSRQDGGDSMNSWTKTKIEVSSLDRVLVELGFAATSVTIFSGDVNDPKREVLARYVGPEVQVTIVKQREVKK